MSYLQPPALDGPSESKSSDELLELTIRFSASIPDLLLSFPLTANATTSALKQRIRAALPPDHANRRIRLIYAGKALDDSAKLHTSLKRLLSRPPSRVATPGLGPYEDVSVNAKGKAAVRDPPVAQPRLYIHCSIGDIVLSPTELAEEAASAHSAEASDSANAPSTGQNAGTAEAEVDGDGSGSTPVPRGFDRLLTAGFTAPEVQSLRLQFMAIQAHTHTPDTMPSPNTLRNMEDRWLDNSNNDSGDAGGLVSMSDEDGQAGALDDMIWGTAIGFFWPLGCLMWGTREEGIFSPRRKIAIVIGVLLNIGLGFVRYGG